MTAVALVWAGMQGGTTLGAEPSGEGITADAPAAEAASQKTSAHLRLCEQLGLKVGQTYVFLIEGNDEYHYWTIRSLGARGWVLVSDSIHPKTWLNLSRVIAVTPAFLNSPEERPRKPNRAR